MNKIKNALPVVAVILVLGVVQYYFARKDHEAKVAWEKKARARKSFELDLKSVEWTRDDVAALPVLADAITALTSFTTKWSRPVPETQWAFARLSHLKQLQAGGVGQVESGTPAAPALPDRLRTFLAKVQEQRQQLFGLRSPNLSAELTTHGGSVELVTLNEYREPSFKPVAQHDKKMSQLEPFRLLRPYENVPVRSFALTSLDEPGLDSAEWLHADGPDGSHVFSRVLGDGDLELEKEFIPSASKDDFHFTLVVRVKNHGDKQKSFGYRLIGAAGMVEPTSAYPQPIDAVIATKDGHGSLRKETRPGAEVVENWKTEKRSLQANADPTVGSSIAFFGNTVKSFACAVVPQGPGGPNSVRAIPLLELAGRAPTPVELKLAEAGEESPAKKVVTEATLSSFPVLKGQPVEHRYLCFVGPRWRRHLLDHPVYSAAGLGELVDYSMWFPGSGYLAQLLTAFLLGFHWLTRSWGLSIVLLTLLVRGCLHPLMLKQQKNSLKMQSLGPEVAKLKEKFTGKDGEMSPENARRFQAEQWALWKKHGINPLGCFGPMLLQLPIFLGLFSALNYAFELRQQSFLWIRDLSEPDVVARIPWFNLPFLGTNAICVLPMLMFLVYMLQMRSMPKPADPQAAEQQKIMNYMMPLFGYLFYRVPSGLLLYYITSALIGMAETRWIKKRLGIVTPGAPVPPAPAKA